VKNLARLALFFSFSFVLIFLVSAGLRFLTIRLDWVRSLPAKPELILPEIIAASHWALSLSVYSSLLLALSYAVRNRVFAPAAAACLIILSLGFSFGISLGLQNWENVTPAAVSVQPLGGPGLILTNTQGPNETSIVLLKGPAELHGPRVAAIPDRPLVYQAEPAGPGGTALDLPPVPFGDNTAWFLKSVAIDLRLNAEHLRLQSSAGPLPFLIYAGALVFFLCALGFIFKISAWPLANLCIACLAFRGVLALETFFNAPEMLDVFDSFLKGRLPPGLTVPLIFCGLGILLYLYSLLAYAAKRRSGDEIEP
jgi:hypothetical protein